MSRAPLCFVVDALVLWHDSGMRQTDPESQPSGAAAHPAARSVPRTARERARAEITTEILDAGRRSLATDGAAGLSLRAIARELGMASSAVYRYVASRDELLTKLIIEAYDSLGAAAESQEASVPREDLAGRLAEICHATRSWALANPNEYALIYGSPVPGYVAPPDTVAPASRVALLATQILVDANSRGIAIPSGASDVSPQCLTALAPILAALPPDLTASAIQAGLMTLAGLFGTVSFELFGQFQNVVADGPGDREAFFDECIRRWAGQLGIAKA
jgi:AcrR family transcriptional regulator